MGVRLIVYPVKHPTAATAFYSKLLGIDPYVAASYYVGFRIDPDGDISALTQAS